MVVHRLRSIMMAKKRNTISAKLNKTNSMLRMTMALHLQAFEPLASEKGAGIENPGPLLTAMTAVRSDAAWRLWRLA